MILVTNVIRVIPVTFHLQAHNESFLVQFLHHYVPYVTLSVMTFPSIVTATSDNHFRCACAVFGVVAAWRGWGLFPVAILCCAVVFVGNVFLISRCLKYFDIIKYFEHLLSGLSYIRSVPNVVCSISGADYITAI